MVISSIGQAIIEGIVGAVQNQVKKKKNGEDNIIDKVSNEVKDKGFYGAAKDLAEKGENFLDKQGGTWNFLKNLGNSAGAIGKYAFGKIADRLSGSFSKLGDKAGFIVSPLFGLLGDGDQSQDPLGNPGNGGIRRYGGSGSGSGSMSGYDSYLDMLHKEQERVWQREDTAYQRTVADLKAAGLNPVLAAGGGVSPAGGSSGADSQVVGAISDLAAMAISGLTETAKGVSRLAAAGNATGGFLNNATSWYKQNSGTIKNAVNTAATLMKMFG